MRLVLDEMLSPVIAHQLRVRGYDVDAVKGDARHKALSDAEVLGLARSTGRVVVTNNVVDFRALHHEAVAPGGAGHFGIVLMAGNFRRTKGDVGRIIRSLEAKLAEHPGDRDLADGETWLDPLSADGGRTSA